MSNQHNIHFYQSINAQHKVLNKICHFVNLGSNNWNKNFYAVLYLLAMHLVSETRACGLNPQYWWNVLIIVSISPMRPLHEIIVWYFMLYDLFEIKWLNINFDIHFTDLMYLWCVLWYKVNVTIFPFGAVLCFVYLTEILPCKSLTVLWTMGLINYLESFLVFIISGDNRYFVISLVLSCCYHFTHHDIIQDPWVCSWAWVNCFLSHTAM